MRAAEPRPFVLLIVDDEPLIRWSLRQAFADRGHAVTTAGSAAEAIAAVAKSPPFDVMILDYRLPDRRDLSLLEDLRRLSPHSRVLMMTAFADESMKARAKELGAAAVVDKPFHVKEIVALVEGVAREG
jgi:DNA-binding response OmpR family regulator